MNRSDISSPSKASQDADSKEFGGGPVFHPDYDTQDVAIRSRRIIPKGISVSTDTANDEQDVLFDGTQAVNGDLYAKTSVLDAKPDSAFKTH